MRQQNKNCRGTIENGRFNTVSVQNDGMMWALVKEKPEVGLWMKRVPIPEVGPNDVKIKIHKTAICGTDVHIYQWNDWAQHTIPVGLTAGHEYVGEVVEVGPGVKGFKIGDLVIRRGTYHMRQMSELSGRPQRELQGCQGRRREQKRSISQSTS